MGAPVGSEELITITCHVTTSHPIEAYGGVKLSDIVLEQIAERLRGGLIPMINQHDPMHPIDCRCLRAQVVELSDGFKAVEADFEVDAEAWAAVEAEWAAVGAPGGFSFSCAEWFDTAMEASLKLAADPHYFSDADIKKAAEIMSSAGTVKAGRLYQFAAVPPPHIVVDLGAVLTTIPVSVLGSAIYDGLKYLLLRVIHRKDEPAVETQIDFHTDSQTLQIRSSDAEVLKHALDRIGDAIESRNGLLAWREEDGDWEARG